MSGLFSGRAAPTPLQTDEKNAINGSDAESYAASQLLRAIRAEVGWGSRNEDGSKIDLFLSFTHPWIRGERIILLVQVKSGASYGSIKGDGFLLRRSVIGQVRRSSHPICIVWVDRDQNRCFWAYVHPNTTDSEQVYRGHHLITPCIAFDIARCQANVSYLTRGGNGVVIKGHGSEVKTLRRLARLRYKELGQTPVISPVLGRVEFTSLAWRHMTRKNRTKIRKTASLETIPYIGLLLKQLPTSHRVMNVHYRDAGGWQHRTTEHVLTFDQPYYKRLHATTPLRKTVRVRLLEEVRYPTNWDNKAMLSQEIERRVVLVSCYYTTK